MTHRFVAHVVRSGVSDLPVGSVRRRIYVPLAVLHQHGQDLVGKPVFRDHNRADAVGRIERVRVEGTWLVARGVLWSPVETGRAVSVDMVSAACLPGRRRHHEVLRVIRPNFAGFSVLEQGTEPAFQGARIECL